MRCKGGSVALRGKKVKLWIPALVSRTGRVGKHIVAEWSDCRDEKKAWCGVQSKRWVWEQAATHHGASPLNEKAPECLYSVRKISKTSANERCDLTGGNTEDKSHDLVSWSWAIDKEKSSVKASRKPASRWEMGRIALFSRPKQACDHERNVFKFQSSFGRDLRAVRWPLYTARISAALFSVRALRQLHFQCFNIYAKGERMDKLSLCISSYFPICSAFRGLLKWLPANRNQFAFLWPASNTTAGHPAFGPNSTYIETLVSFRWVP